LKPGSVIPAIGSTISDRDHRSRLQRALRLGFRALSFVETAMRRIPLGGQELL
jgi:hypothetical protein